MYARQIFNNVESMTVVLADISMLGFILVQAGVLVSLSDISDLVIICYSGFPDQCCVFVSGVTFCQRDSAGRIAKAFNCKLAS